MGFYWLASFLLASGGYFVLRAVLPSGAVFGAWYRMLLYHWSHPLAYIAIPCFFYGILATLFTKNFTQKTARTQLGRTAIVIGLTVLLSSPFGGMLWCFHDMQAGYFPANWLWVMLSEGTLQGLALGWLVVLLSVPYSLLGCAVCYFLNKAGASFLQKTERIFEIN